MQCMQYQLTSIFSKKQILSKHNMTISARVKLWISHKIFQKSNLRRETLLLERQIIDQP